MWSGLQWATCVLGLALLTVTLLSLAIFIAFIRKYQDEFFERILNVLFAKGVVINFIFAIILFVQMMFHQSELIISASLKIFATIVVFLNIIKLLTILEISIFSLLRLFSPGLYMLASLNLPVTYISFVQAFMIMMFLLNNKAAIVDAQTREEFRTNVTLLLKTKMATMLVIIFILHVIGILR